MRIRTQFTITLIIFSLVVIIIGLSIALTSQQVTKTRTQENLANNIVHASSDLTYLSNDYVFYQGNQQLIQWQARYTSFSKDVGNLSVDTPEQQALVQKIQANQLQMKIVFDSIVSIVETSQNQNADETLSTLQVSWSRMSIQSQTLIDDASKLAELLGNQVDHLNTQNIILVFAMVGSFSAFLAVIYVQTFRRTLKSISELREGTNLIGLGNLDFKIKDNKKDEIGELSHAFNQMTADLKTVTASKSDLEKEMAERKRLEEKSQQLLRTVQQERDRISSLLNSITDEVWFADTEKKLTLANPSAIKEFKLDSLGTDDVENIAVSFEVYRSDGSPRPVEEAPPLRALKGEILTNQVEIVKTPASGELRYRQVSAAPVRDGEGNIIGSVSVVRDITELKLLQNRLQKYSEDLEKLVEERTKQLGDAERLASIGATAGMVGHDIRNPLQAITSDVYLAKTELASIPESEEKKNAIESLDEIEKNIFYINKIVADLQDYARPLNPVAKETNLQKLIDELLSKNDFAKNIKVHVKVRKEAATIMADSDILRRILGNLVINAVQAMPEGGRLSIQAYKEANDSIITVEDTGVGIAEEAKEKLFRPLFTTKSKGQGFGLAVVKRMTESLGGTVTFESEEGKGTKFILRFSPKA